MKIDDFISFIIVDVAAVILGIVVVVIVVSLACVVVFRLFPFSFSPREGFVFSQTLCRVRPPGLSLPRPTLEKDRRERKKMSPSHSEKASNKNNSSVTILPKTFRIIGNLSHGVSTKQYCFMPCFSLENAGRQCPQKKEPF